MLVGLKFKDIYLAKERAWLSGVPNTKDPVLAPAEAEGDLQELRRILAERQSSASQEEFPVRSAGVSYRVSVLKSITEVVYVLRRMPSTIPSPEELSIHPAYVDMLLKPGLNGLVVVAGAFGHGKTTTASSMIAARLKKFGGIGVTIEDPPEMPLQGNHGEGVCFQTEAEYGKFGEACRKANRWTPTIMFIGEVRDSESAAEALRWSINGRLVICTVHADSAAMAVERMYSLANGSIANPEDTSSLLANGLLAVLHQRLEGEPRKPKLEFLWLGDQDATGVRNNIRQRRWEHLGNEVQMQRNRLMVQRRPAGEGETRSVVRG